MDLNHFDVKFQCYHNSTLCYRNYHENLSLKIPKNILSPIKSSIMSRQIQMNSKPEDAKYIKCGVICFEPLRMMLKQAR